MNNKCFYSISFLHVYLARKWCTIQVGTLHFRMWWWFAGVQGCYGHNKHGIHVMLLLLKIYLRWLEAKPIKGRWDVRAQPIHRWSCSMGRNALAKSGPSKLSWRLQEGRSSPPGVFMLIQKSVIIFFLPLESSSSNMLHLPPASFSSFYIEVLLIYLWSTSNPCLLPILSSLYLFLY